MFASLLENGTIGLYGGSSVLSLLLDLEVDGCELEDGDESFGVYGTITGEFDTDLLELR